MRLGYRDSVFKHAAPQRQVGADGTWVWAWPDVL